MRKIQNQRGAALVIVLALLIVILGLAITFLNRVSIERTSSASYASAANTRQLADAAVNLVQGQIRAATTQGDNIAWASQPGMIRTYGSGSGNSSTASSAFLTAFKLYSASNMVQTSKDTLSTEDAPAATWASDKAIWTDINAPVTVTAAAGNSTSYPIIDPSLAGTVQGFTITAAPGATNGQPVPMPVRWLYVTQNGSLVAATGTGNTTTISGANATTNPIVGRIAFWTDDETSKININTAAGDLQDLGTLDAGAFWDIPRMSSTFDKTLAKNQPVKNEFQRYPGHPATVSLTSVMGNLTRAQIADIAPRIVFGGSEGGNKTTVTTNGSTASVGNLTIDSNRLYSSVDELAFTQNRASSILTSASISTYGFLLTTASRAPELNLFGKPRIALWPLNANATNRTPVDKLIAFCSSMNATTPYFFQRSDSQSPTADASISRNTQLYGYLQNLSSKLIPGFGNQSFTAKYGVNDTNQILTEIQDYIRCVNMRDAQTAAVPFTRKLLTDGSISTPTAGQVTPLQNSNGTMGFGRSYTISEAALVFMATSSTTVSANASATTLPMANSMKALLVFELFSPSLGYPYINPGLKFALTVTKPLTVNGIDYNFCATEEYITEFSSTQLRPMGGGNGVGVSLRYYRSGRSDANKTILTALGTGSVSKFGFITLDIPLMGNSTVTANGTHAGETFNFGGMSATLTISPYDGSNVGTAFQTIELRFPGNGTFGNATSGNATFALPAPLLSPENSPNNRISNAYGDFQLFIMPEDTVISLEPSGTGYRGDFRQVAMTKSVPLNAFQPQQRYSTLTPPVFSNATVTVNGTTMTSGSITTARKDYNNKAHSLRLGNSFGFLGAQNANPVPLSYDDTSTSAYGSWNATNTATYGNRTLTFAGFTYNNGVAYSHPDYPTSLSLNIANMDTDTGVGVIRDGPYVNMADASCAYNPNASVNANQALPYYTYDSSEDTDFSFSANRQVASAAQLGSLPAGFKPWQTLLFRPPNTTSSVTHPSAASLPRDYLLLDLFWMPVVEPYAISEPSSTAGRINLNYQIMPFSYIERSTAVRAAMDSTMVTAIPETLINTMKGFNNDVGTQRFRINTSETDGTLAYFKDRFDLGDIFRSASEICDIPLVPIGKTKANMATYWDDKRITGDNVRETPYNHLFPLFTTKSNTYTVHFRVQALKKVPSTSATVWDETKDKVVGEYRGSTTIERYINPNESSIKDYAANPAENNLESYYKWRVLNNRQFAP